MALETSRFIQGLYEFSGAGLKRVVPLSPPVKYTVPFDKRAQLIYLRAGNALPDMIYLVLLRDGKPLRYFPIGAKGSVHVPLAIVDDIAPESNLELCVGAPEGASGQVLVDMGMVEV